MARPQRSQASSFAIRRAVRFLALVGFCISSPAKSIAFERPIAIESRDSQSGESSLQESFAPRSWKISGRLMNRYDKVYRRLDQSPLMLTDHFRLQAALRFSVQPDPQLQCELELAMTKYWNPWWLQKTPSKETGSTQIESPQTASIADFNLAYARYAFFDKQFEFWVGRLPLVSGDPLRAEYFPLLAFGNIHDGALVAYQPISNVTDRLRLLAGYSPFLLMNYNFRKVATGQKPSFNGGQTDVENLSPMGFLGADYQSRGGLAKSFQASLYHNWVNYLRYPDAVLDSSVLDPSLTGTSTVRSNLSLFLKYYSVYVEWNQIAGTTWKFSWNRLVTQLKSEGGLLVTAGTSLGQSYGFGTLSSAADLDGRMDAITASVTPSLFVWGDFRPTIGLQALFSDRGYFFSDGKPEDPVGLYETRGEAYHAFLSQKLTPSFVARGGFIRQNWFWAPLGFGEVRGDGSRVDTFYAQLTALVD